MFTCAPHGGTQERSAHSVALRGSPGARRPEDACTLPCFGPHGGRPSWPPTRGPARRGFAVAAPFGRPWPKLSTVRAEGQAIEALQSVGNSCQITDVASSVD